MRSSHEPPRADAHSIIPARFPFPLTHSRTNSGSKQTPSPVTSRLPALARCPHSIPGGCVIAMLWCIPAVQMPTRNTKTYPKAKRFPRGYQNNKETAMRACRAACHGFQLALILAFRFVITHYHSRACRLLCSYMVFCSSQIWFLSPLKYFFQPFMFSYSLLIDLKAYWCSFIVPFVPLRILL